LLLRALPGRHDLVEFVEASSGELQSGGSRWVNVLAADPSELPEAVEVAAHRGFLHGKVSSQIGGSRFRHAGDGDHEVELPNREAMGAEMVVIETAETPGQDARSGDKTGLSDTLMELGHVWSCICNRSIVQVPD
jgi:hypothetical protein